MAKKRMFSTEIVDTDAFLSMPLSAQALYFHFGMHGDDDGFIGHPKKVMRVLGSTEEDFKILLEKRFIFEFDTGVICMKHWRMNNYIQKDRYSETNYSEEKAQIKVKRNGSYTECIQRVDKMSPIRIQPVSTLDTQYRLDKVSLDKTRLGEVREGGVGETIDQPGNEIEPVTPEPETQLTPTQTVKPITPKQKAQDFFENPNTQLEVVTKLNQLYGVPTDVGVMEIKKFINYWTERNGSGTKQRWEMQETFEINRRLVTWFGNKKEFSNQNNNSTAVKI